MARPRLRTERLTPAEVRAMRTQFGTFRNAQRQLDPAGAVNSDRFRVAVAGHYARPEDVLAIRTAYATWKASHLRVPPDATPAATPQRDA